MKILKSNIFLLLLASALFASCMSDEAAECPADTDKMSVTFTLVTGGDRATRAGTWSENETSATSADHGTEYETKIDPGKLQVLVYNPTDNTLIGKVEQLTYIRDTQNQYIYHFTGVLPLDSWNMKDGQFNGKIVVLANSDTYSPAEGTALSDMLPLAFNYVPTEFAGTTPTASIPMWGVKTVNVTLTAGEAKDIGDIYILRAMSKIKVMVDADATNNLKLNSVKLTKYNKSGYVLPSGYAAVNNTELLTTTDKSFNPKDDAVEAEIPFTKDEDGSYNIYVPEYDNKNNDALITVNAQDDNNKTAKDYTIELKDYDKTTGQPKTDAEPKDIIRNTVYQYAVKSIDSQGLRIKYKVMPWTVGGINDINYKFSSTLTADSYKTTTTPAVAVTYGKDKSGSYTGHSPWLTLAVKTSYTWILHIDNPNFGFLVDGSTEIVDQIKTVGDKTIKFKVVPRSAVDNTPNRSYRAAMFVSILSYDGSSNKVSFNIGDSPMPGDDEEIVFYQITPTEYDKLN